jgi:hypothetical protein
LPDSSGCVEQTVRYDFDLILSWLAKGSNNGEQFRLRLVQLWTQERRPRQLNC